MEVDARRDDRMRNVPTFVGLGVLKCGTTLLHSWLRDHPEIGVPVDRKEVDFFDLHYERGVEWYIDLFSECGAKRAYGEFSTSYLYDPRAIERIARDFPTIKCLIALRNPITRAQSQYKHWKQVTSYRENLEVYLREHPNTLERGNYSHQVERAFSVLGRERCLVTIFEEFTSHPETSAKELYSFLGVDPNHAPASINERMNPSMLPRFPLIWRLRRSVNTFAKRHDLSWLLVAGSYLPGRRWLAAPASDQSALNEGMDDRTIEWLGQYYEEEIHRTGQILGRDLRATWGTKRSASLPGS